VTGSELSSCLTVSWGVSVSVSVPVSVSGSPCETVWRFGYVNGDGNGDGCAEDVLRPAGPLGKCPVYS
jgi:hypothetical protein